MWRFRGLPVGSHATMPATEAFVPFRSCIRAAMCRRAATRVRSRGASGPFLVLAMKRKELDIVVGLPPPPGGASRRLSRSGSPFYAAQPRPVAVSGIQRNALGFDGDLPQRAGTAATLEEKRRWNRN